MAPDAADDTFASSTFASSTSPKSLPKASGGGMAHHEAYDGEANHMEDDGKGPLELWRSACMQILMRLRADTPFDPFARSCVGIRDGCLRLFGQAPVRVIGAGRWPLRFLLLVQLARERWDSDEAIDDRLSEPTTVIGNPHIDGQSSTIDVAGGGGGGPELVCSWPYFCGPSEWKALQAVAKTAAASAVPTEEASLGLAQTPPDGANGAKVRPRGTRGGRKHKR